MDEVINDLDRNSVPLNIYLDLSKAFDTILSYYLNYITMAFQILSSIFLRIIYSIDINMFKWVQLNQH